MSIWTRVRNLFRSDALNREIAEEMESHIAEAIESGRHPVEARRAFGSVTKQYEASHQARVLGWMDSLRADVSFGWGQLIKRKVTTVAAVLSLALAIGACTSASRLVHALFLRPLPVSHPERLYAIQYRGVDAMVKPRTEVGSGYPQFLRMRDAAMERPLVRAVRQNNSGFTVNQVISQEQLSQDQLIRERLLATLAGFFAAVGLLLAAIGLYGVLHYSVVQREKEIGIRIALGATLGSISRLVTARTFLMVLLGAITGMGAGLISAQFVASLLYGVKATDVSMMAITANRE